MNDCECFQIESQKIRTFNEGHAAEKQTAI